MFKLWEISVGDFKTLLKGKNNNRKKIVLEEGWMTERSGKIVSTEQEVDFSNSSSQRMYLDYDERRF